jgi:hypothetical protein
VLFEVASGNLIDVANPATLWILGGLYANKQNSLAVMEQDQIPNIDALNLSLNTLKSNIDNPYILQMFKV